MIIGMNDRTKFSRLLTSIQDCGIPIEQLKVQEEGPLLIKIGGTKFNFTNDGEYIFPPRPTLLQKIFRRLAK